LKKNILFCNQKGGVGKSTICAELVLSLRRTGIPYNFYDLDQQGGTILDPVEDQAAAVSVIDTPGALTDKLADWLRESSVVCIPVRPSALEMASARLMLDAYKANRQPRAKLVIVVNQFTRWTSSRDFLEWITAEASRRKCNARITTLIQSEAILQAGAFGASVVDFAPKSPAAASALEVINAIRQAAGLKQEVRT